MATESLPPRYKALRRRSFERHLDLYLTAIYLLDGDSQLGGANLATYKKFESTAELRAAYLRAEQAPNLREPFAHSRTVQDLDKAIRQWRVTNPVLEAELRTIHDQHHCLSLTDFQQLISTQAGELACEYCELKESEFRRLIALGIVRTKRLRTRGRSFEFDCRDPQHGYEAGNVALCCYWCNNAKTDEFDVEEFKPIALALAAAWRQRLAKHTST
ncbi:hypothetical protein [Hymenobacter actinosclerus]|uniref:Uncharacterized protein n=1 Tax=Hymenobacter actinosclerus TaxID=82805 RepID=A0A1I0INX1_9BACT|nr:hypothetical protein [Hymenobacter actinosclerus]SET98100.1 hypothetical protein SAMN04487998_3380 [Hymenobacter actinosclerus]